MPHPLIDNVSSTLAGLRVRLKHVTGAEGPWITDPSVCVSRSSWLSMPASVNNPVKPDGTRDPSPFYTYRFLAVCPPASIVQGPNGRWGWHTVESTSAAYCTRFIGPDARWNWRYLRPNDIFMANIDHIARVNFLKKLEKASGKGKVELGVAAGEVRETIGMASELVTGLVSGVLKIAKETRQSPQRVAQALDSLSRLTPKQVAKQVLNQDTALLERIVKGWLVTQFGLIPLTSDLYDGTVYLGAQQQENQGLRLTISVKSGYDSEPTEVLHRAIEGGDNSATYSVDAKFLWYGKVHYACRYQIPTRATIPQELGLYNPALVGWELVQFSWLVDYVVDIGGWLRSMMAAQDTVFIDGTRSELRQARFVEWVDVDDGYSAGTPVASQLNALQCSIAADSFNRDLLGSGVMPPFFPGVRNLMNLNRLANSLSALTVMVGVRSRSGPPVIKY